MLGDLILESLTPSVNAPLISTFKLQIFYLNSESLIQSNSEHDKFRLMSGSIWKEFGAFINVGQLSRKWHAITTLPWFAILDHYQV